MEWNSRRVLGVILCVVLLSSFFGYYFAVTFAGYQGDVGTFYIEKGTQVEASYVVSVWNSSHYSVLNGTNGRRTYGTNASEIINDVLAVANSVLIKSGVYLCDSPLIPKNYIWIKCESSTTIIRATSSMDALFDASDKTNVQVFGGYWDGNNLAEKTMDFSLSTGLVSFNRVERAKILNGTVCLLDITLNSAFQFEENLLDGCDNTPYGIVQNNSDGANFLQLGDYNDFCTEAVILLGGGGLTITNGGLEAESGCNIKVTSAYGNPRLSIFGTWMESTAGDNILIEEGLGSLLLLHIEPLHMYVNGSGGYANIRSTTTTNHTKTLVVEGGYWETSNATGYHIDARIDYEASIQTAYFSRGWAGVNTAKFDVLNGFSDGKGILRCTHPYNSTWTSNMNGFMWYCTDHDRIEYYIYPRIYYLTGTGT